MSSPLEGTRILCVDDSADSLELLRVVLTRKGAHVTTCTTAEEAITTLMEMRFDVVVSDLTMPPGLDGYDLAHALRKMEDQDPSRPSTPSVAVSGDAMRPSAKRRFADFQVYLAKPFDKGNLLSIVERLVEADGEVVKAGSLGIWEAERATTDAALDTAAAQSATADAAAATTAAATATSAAQDATEAATSARLQAAKAEMRANPASTKAPSF